MAQFARDWLWCSAIRSDPLLSEDIIYNSRDFWLLVIHNCSPLQRPSKNHQQVTILFHSVLLLGGRGRSPHYEHALKSILLPSLPFNFQGRSFLESILRIQDKIRINHVDMVQSTLLNPRSLFTQHDRCPSFLRASGHTFISPTSHCDCSGRCNLLR